MLRERERESDGGATKQRPSLLRRAVSTTTATSIPRLMHSAHVTVDIWQSVWLACPASGTADTPRYLSTSMTGQKWSRLDQLSGIVQVLKKHLGIGSDRIGETPVPAQAPAGMHFSKLPQSWCNLPFPLWQGMHACIARDIHLPNGNVHGVHYKWMRRSELFSTGRPIFFFLSEFH